MEQTYEIKIPIERIPVLIGSKGTIKRKIEKETDTVLEIDSHDGLVTLAGGDALNLLDAREIVRAIARGFNPEVAMLLLKQDYLFELIDLSQITRNKTDMNRVKGRIIGENGKSRKTIESLTDTYVSVYGKTVGVVGEMTGVGLAKRALSMLLQGAPHASVYQMLERQRRKLKMDRVQNW